jgi:cytochrome P450
MRASRVSSMRFISAVRRRGFLAAVGDLWHEFGDVFEVRLGRSPTLFAIHPDAVEHVTVSGRDHYDKVKSYDGVRRYLLGQGLVASTGDLWRRQRKLMAPFYTPRGVQAYAGVMINDGLRLADRWGELATTGAEIDVSDEMTEVTASIILESMFSATSPESITEIRDTVGIMLGFIGRNQVGIRLPLAVPTRGNRDYLRARSLVHSTIAEIIAERRAIEVSQWPDDLLARLMLARDPDTGEAMSEELLRDEAITTFFAGHETTARTMTFTWFLLAKHPEAADRLHDELDTVLGDRDPTVADLRSLPYALGVVKEVLRLYPAAAFYARDAVADDRVGEVDVRAGTAVLLSPYYTHRHPDFWSEPERFDPGRWAPGAEETRHSHQYHPFAAGPRICIGNNFSLLESHLLLAILARRFVPRPLADAGDRVVMRGTLTFAGGLPAVIGAR